MVDRLFNDLRFQGIDPDEAVGDGDNKAAPLDVAVEWGVRSNHRAIKRRPPGASTNLHRRQKITTVNPGTIYRAPYLVHPGTSEIQVTFLGFPEAPKSLLENVEADQTPRVRFSCYLVLLSDVIDARGFRGTDGSVWIPENEGSNILKWITFEIPTIGAVDQATWGFINLDIQIDHFEFGGREVYDNTNTTYDTEPSFWKTGGLKTPLKSDYPNGPDVVYNQLETPSTQSRSFELNGRIQDGDSGANLQEIYIANATGPWVDDYDLSDRNPTPDVQVRHIVRPVPWVRPVAVSIDEYRQDVDDIEDSAIARQKPVDASFSSYQHGREARSPYSDLRPMIFADVGDPPRPVEGAPKRGWHYFDDSGTGPAVFDQTGRYPMERVGSSTGEIVCRWSGVSVFPGKFHEDIPKTASKARKDSGLVEISGDLTVEQLQTGANGWADALQLGQSSFTYRAPLIKTYMPLDIPILGVLYYEDGGTDRAINHDCWREGILYPTDRGVLDISQRSVTINTEDLVEETPVRVRLSLEVSDVLQDPADESDVTAGEVRGAVTDASVWA